MKKITGKKVGEIFVDLKVINRSQLEEVLNIQRKTGGYLGEILLQLGFITEENFAYAFTLQFGQDLPFINLEKHNIDFEVIKLIPREFVERYRIVPVEKFRDILTIAIASPEGLEETLEKLQEIVDVDLIEVVLTTIHQIYKAIARYYQL